MKKNPMLNSTDGRGEGLKLFFEHGCRQSFLIGSVIMVTAMMFFSLSCGSAEDPDEIAAMFEEEDLSIPELPYESKGIFRMHMNSLDDSFDSLQVSIDTQDWERIRTYAMQMNKSSPVLFTGKRKEELPHDYVLLDTRFHYHTLALVVASEEREMVNLNIEFEKVKETCDGCHVKYKKKES
ncbi:MAG: hypothetical protein GY941_01425 [Planctomycetes bacterium]|nr:hypothetical protein [Planctomycetota bacterium]